MQPRVPSVHAVPFTPLRAESADTKRVFAGRSGLYVEGVQPAAPPPKEFLEWPELLNVQRSSPIQFYSAARPTIQVLNSGPSPAIQAILLFMNS